jgi:hypothetical protein
MFRFAAKRSSGIDAIRRLNVNANKSTLFYSLVLSSLPLLTVARSLPFVDGNIGINMENPSAYGFETNRQLWLKKTPRIQQ